MNKFFLSQNKVKNKVVLLRAGLNVPLNEKGNIENDFRLKSLLPTLKYLIENNNNKVILMGHIGRDPKISLKKVFKYFQKKQKLPIFFDRKTFVGFNDEKILQLKSKIGDLKNGEILLLDNLRATELEKVNNMEFAKKIASLGDVYVNDAFSVAHRKHASVYALPQIMKKKYLGFQFEKELDNLEKIREVGLKDNAIAILGGAKTHTKIPLLKNLLEKFQIVIVGGVIANTFYNQLGYEIGKSKFDDNANLDNLLTKENLFLPNLVLVKNKKGIVEKEISEIDEDDNIIDISPSAFINLEGEFQKVEYVFFNGPLGFYEGGYKEGTRFLINNLASDNNFFVAGGGNTISAIEELNLQNKINFISTGGGSLIDYIVDGELVVLENF